MREKGRERERKNEREEGRKKEREKKTRPMKDGKGETSILLQRLL